MVQRRRVPLQVHGDDCVPLTLVHARDEGVPKNAGVVDQHVESTELADGLLDEALGPVPGGNVVCVGNGLAACSDDLVDYLLCGTGICAGSVVCSAEIVDHDARTLASEEQRMLTADAASCSGDDRYATVETSHQFRFPSVQLSDMKTHLSAMTARPSLMTRSPTALVSYEYDVAPSAEPDL